MMQHYNGEAMTMGRSVKYNNLTSPELLEKVNKNNMDLGKEFLDYLKKYCIREKQGLQIELWQLATNAMRM